jgi:hypothetical protein
MNERAKCLFTLLGAAIFALGVLLLIVIWSSPAHGEESEPSPVSFKLIWHHPKAGEKGTTVTGHNTCFPVSTTQVLTAMHSLMDDGVEQPCFMVVNGVEYPLTPTKYCKRLDLVLLTVTGVLLTPIEMKDVMDGPLVFDGFPLGHPQKCKGRVEEYYWNGDTRHLAKLSFFDHGLSGCPVTQGDFIVGMGVSGVPKDGGLDGLRGLFIPASALKWFLATKTP